MALTITKDILFDKFGDVSFSYGDIEAITDVGDIFYQNTIHRLISKFNDYKNNPNVGPNIPNDIGKPVSLALEQSIKNRIIYSLTSDNLLAKSEINILSFSQNDKIYYRINIFIRQGTSLAYEKITITSIFNPGNGLLYANNYTNI